MNDSDDLVVEMSWNALNAVTKVTKSNEFVLITKRIPRASLLGKKGGHGKEVLSQGCTSYLGRNAHASDV